MSWLTFYFVFLLNPHEKLFFGVVSFQTSVTHARSPHGPCPCERCLGSKQVFLPFSLGFSYNFTRCVWVFLL